MSTLSTHVLDSVQGRPASGVFVRLEQAAVETDGWKQLAAEFTDDDGRVGRIGPDLEAGVYRLVFATAGYFAATGQPTFYPEVPIVFEITDPDQHYHVPLLLSPFAYSTYRGS